MVDAPTLRAIHDLLAALRNAVRPPGQVWQWDAFFEERLARIEESLAKPSSNRDPTGKFQRAR